MARSIQEIKRLRDLGRMKWGKSLLEFLKPYIDEGLTNQDVADMLSADFDFHITVNALKNLRFNYKNKMQITEPVRPVPTSPQRSAYESIFGSKIAQKQESEKVKENGLVETERVYTIAELAQVADEVSTDKKPSMLNLKGAKF